MLINTGRIKEFLYAQLNDWTLARENYAALKNISVKEFNVKGLIIKVQFNPARIVSSGAKVDEKSIKERPCFLCAKNRPMEQKSMLYGDYEILVNPFPIFPEHFTISAVEHTEQLIYNRFSDMLDLAKALDGYVIFYNGPECGASAPDHAHFQAGSKGFLPIENVIFPHCKFDLQSPANKLNHAMIIQSAQKDTAISLFQQLYNSLEIKGKEPMMNVLAWHEKDVWTVAVFPRKKHRPDCYYVNGEANILISPAAVDLGGVFITPLQKDFEKITKAGIERILQEVCI
jgi:ATP adenylyltransferase/5',5'''-P-1,P-4-tetraphosphate phosphorylase II